MTCVLVGGVTGSLGKVSGVLGDAAAMLTFDTEFQKDRKKAAGSIGEGVEGVAKVATHYLCLLFVCGEGGGGGEEGVGEGVITFFLSLLSIFFFFFLG